MATIIRIPGTDFSTLGLPPINPFVAIADAAFAFDFRSRTNRLVDQSVNGVTLTAYRNDIAAAIRTVDPTVVADASGGLGINVAMGFLRASVQLVTLPIDGSVQFTIMVVGGDSGIAWDPAKTVGTAPGICSLYENGTGITAAGYSLETNTGLMGIRIKSGGPVMYDTAAANLKQIMFLTFNGTTWTLINKTLGTTYNKSNATLGITVPLTMVTTQSSDLVFGHVHNTSTIAARPPTLYQIAKWNRVLTGAEITDQTARTRASFPGIGL